MSVMDLPGAVWRKSSRSDSNEGSCVEVAAWRKSSRSGSNEGSCVEVAAAWRADEHGGHGAGTAPMAADLTRAINAAAR